MAKDVANITRRTDFLVDSEQVSPAICLILDVFRTCSEGGMIMALVKSGMLVEGQYFVAGTAFGRIRNLFSCLDWKDDSNDFVRSKAWKKIELRG